MQQVSHHVLLLQVILLLNIYDLCKEGKGISNDFPADNIIQTKN
jgi:hypothetical protein